MKNCTVNKSGIEFQLAEASNLPNSLIKALAEDLRSQLFKNEKKVDMGAAVSKLGGTLEVESGFDKPSIHEGSIYIQGKRNFSINIAEHTSYLKDRFTIAHEIAHYFLHYLYPLQVLKKELGPTYARRFGKDLAETEANIFAANFLMPEKLFTEEFQKSTGSLYLLSEKFEVSTVSCYYRSIGLGLIADR